MNWKVTFILLSLTWLSSPLSAASPFGQRAATPDSNQEISLQKNSLATTLIQKQQELRENLAHFSRQFKQTGTPQPLLFVLLLAFIYGMLHALGPGHGKSIVVSYLITEQERQRLRRGIFLGSSIAFLESISALSIVYGLYYFSMGRVRTQFEITGQRIQVFSYSIIILLGVFLLIRAFKSLQKGEQHHCCGHHYKTKGSRFSTALAIGLIPCPGTMLLLVFCLSLNLPLLGVALTISMAMGMTVTISAIGIATIYSKHQLLKRLESRQRQYVLAEKLIALAGALLMVLIGSFFLLGML